MVARVKLLLTIVQDGDVGKLRKALIERGFGATRLSSTGGFLRQGNTTFLIGVEDDRLAEAKALIMTTCCRRKELVTPGTSLADLEGVYSSQMTEIVAGGATIFVLNVEEHIKV